MVEVSSEAMTNARWLLGAMEAMRRRMPSEMTSSECATLLDVVEGKLDLDLVARLREDMNDARRKLTDARTRVRDLATECEQLRGDLRGIGEHVEQYGGDGILAALPDRVLATMGPPDP